MDICDLDLLQPFFSQEVEVHTTVEVFHELPPAHRTQYLNFSKEGKLYLHTLSGEEHITLYAQNHPCVFSTTDKTAIYLALKLDVIVISSDSNIRKYGPLKAVDKHSMLWIIDNL